MERAARPRADWTLGGRSTVVLLALSSLATLVWGLRSAAQEAPTPPALAGVLVVVNDGTDARLWIERADAAPRVMPLAFETTPGPVSLRVARHTADGAWRQDTVELDLQLGALHLVPIGGQPVRIEALQVQGPPRELPWSYHVPGVLVWPAERGTIGPGEPGQERMTLATEIQALADPNSYEEGWLPEGERLLIAANPFLQEVRCSVAAQHRDASMDWRQEFSLPALGCRVIALGSASAVQVSSTRASDGAFLGESRSTRPAEPGRPVLYTVGGATLYAWLGEVEGTMPPVPNGEWAELPNTLRLRPRHAGDPPYWLLVAAGPGGGPVGLSPLASAPLAALGEAHPVRARADVVVRELALPAELQGKGVGAVAAAGADLLALVDGVVHDTSTGKPLHALEGERVAQMAATPHGLVLFTRSGRLASIVGGRLVLGASGFDPTLRLAPAAGDPAAVWLYGGAFDGATLVRQPLDGTPGTLQVRSEPGEELPLDVTALGAAGGGGLLMASGRRIERLQPQFDLADVWAIEPVLTLPEEQPDVIGLLDLGGRLLFASLECVYELRGNLVLPLAEGIGGPLVAWRSGLVVCDERSGRLYHLSGPAFAAPNGAAK